jgi:hypothetical protein
MAEVRYQKSEDSLPSIHHHRMRQAFQPFAVPCRQQEPAQRRLDRYQSFFLFVRILISDFRY